MKRGLFLILIIILASGCTQEKITGSAVKTGQAITGAAIKENVGIEIGLPEATKNPEIIEKEILVKANHISYFPKEIKPSTKVDYEIKSIKDPEQGINTATSIYIHFLKSENDLSLAVDRHNFEFYNCTPKIQITKAKGICILDYFGFIIKNTHSNKDALVKIKLIIYS